MPAPRFSKSNPPQPSDYRWYARVFDPACPDELQQGDILEQCPTIDIPPSFYPMVAEALKMHPAGEISVPTEFKAPCRDLIVMTQSCDLAANEDGAEQVATVMLCQLWEYSEVALVPPFSKSGFLGNAAAGKLTGYYLLNKCTEPDCERHFLIVAFDEMYTLPIHYVRQIASRGPHLRLLPPYREHLSKPSPFLHAHWPSQRHSERRVEEELNAPELQPAAVPLHHSGHG